VRLAGAYLRRDFREDVGYRFSFVLDLIDALVLLAAVYFLSRGLGPVRTAGYEPFGFLFTGLAVNGALSVCLICFAQSVRGSRAGGTLRATLIMPTSATVQALSSAAYPMLRGLIDAGLHLAAAALLGLSLSRANVPGALLVLALGLAAASAVGIASAAFAIVFRRGDPLLWLIGVTGMLLGGVFYPVEQLPQTLRALSWITPVAPALSAMRPLLLDGAALGDVRSPLLALAAYALAGVPLSLALFNRAVHHARRTAGIRET
jgi:ABC-2 type transport system permease protein